jgi:hypothetical protein
MSQSDDPSGRRCFRITPLAAATRLRHNLRPSKWTPDDRPFGVDRHNWDFWPTAVRIVRPVLLGSWHFAWHNSLVVRAGDRGEAGEPKRTLGRYYRLASSSTAPSATGNRGRFGRGHPARRGSDGLRHWWKWTEGCDRDSSKGCDRDPLEGRPATLRCRQRRCSRSSEGNMDPR